MLSATSDFFSGRQLRDRRPTAKNLSMVMETIMLQVMISKIQSKKIHGNKSTLLLVKSMNKCKFPGLIELPNVQFKITLLEGDHLKSGSLAGQKINKTKCATRWSIHELKSAVYSSIYRCWRLRTSIIIETVDTYCRIRFLPIRNGQR